MSRSTKFKRCAELGKIINHNDNTVNNHLPINSFVNLTKLSNCKTTSRVTSQNICYELPEQFSVLRGKNNSVLGNKHTYSVRNTILIENAIHFEFSLPEKQEAGWPTWQLICSRKCFRASQWEQFQNGASSVMFSSH